MIRIIGMGLSGCSSYSRIVVPEPKRNTVFRVFNVEIN